MRLIIDAHLDLAWCAVHFNRDLTRGVAEVRQREREMTDEPARGKNTLTLPELKRAGIGLCVATLLARSGPAQAVKRSYGRTDLDYATQDIAHCHAQAQLTYYRLLERRGLLRFIKSRGDFDSHWSNLNQRGVDACPLGIILSMEGADPIVTLDHAQLWWDAGLRAVGLAHYGIGQYAYGTGVDGPLSAGGVELLREFARLGIINDATHLSDISFFQAMDVCEGPWLASHHACRALVPNDRQLTDEQVRLLIQRDAVIGAPLDAWMLFPNWVRGKTQPTVVGLDAVADHIDHVCQLAGNVNHAAIGSDLDGGFGYEQTPRDLNTITDLQKLDGILGARGYSDADIDLIFHGNWLRFFRAALPDA
jgi:membrane dipeptidase